VQPPFKDKDQNISIILVFVGRCSCALVCFHDFSESWLRSSLLISGLDVFGIHGSEYCIVLFCTTLVRRCARHTRIAVCNFNPILVLTGEEAGLYVRPSHTAVSCLTFCGTFEGCMIQRLLYRFLIAYSLSVRPMSFTRGVFLEPLRPLTKLLSTSLTVVGRYVLDDESNDTRNTRFTPRNLETDVICYPGSMSYRQAATRVSRQRVCTWTRSRKGLFGGETGMFYHTIEYSICSTIKPHKF